VNTATKTRKNGVSLLIHDTAVSERVIGCAIEVHKELGPGLLEAVYEEALCIEMSEQGLVFGRQLGIPATYKQRLIGEYRPDLVVENTIVVEVKSVERLHDVHVAQVVTYLRLLGLKVGLLLNFNCSSLKTGIRRVIT
jgi:GxxExxY protein